MLPPTSPLGKQSTGADMAAYQNVLLAGEARGFLAWATVLDRKGLRIRAMRTGVEARSELAAGSTHAVIVIDPLSDLPTGSFVEEIIRARPENLKGVLVVTGDDEDPPTLPLGKGIKVHCCQSGDGDCVEEAILDILELEIRVAIRLEIQLEVAIGSSSAALPGLTKNISNSGLLIETGAALIPGVRSRIRIELPGSLHGPIEADVEVVRHRKPSQHQSPFIAVRFVDVSNEQAYRWKRFLEAQR